MELPFALHPDTQALRLRNTGEQNPMASGMQQCGIGRGPCNPPLARANERAPVNLYRDLTAAHALLEQGRGAGDALNSEGVEHDPSLRDYGRSRGLSHQKGRDLCISQKSVCL